MNWKAGVAASVGQRIGTAQRAAEIVSALTRFGFGEIVGQPGFERFRSKAATNEDGEIVARKPLPERVRLLIEELGPTFIKAGQVMSTRPDIVPAEWIDELKKLQSDVPAVDWDGDAGVRVQLESEYGERLEEVFEWIDETPLAAASMAQVHRARIRADGDGEGEHVVLKILRPGIREEMASDLDLMRLFARLTSSYFANLGLDARDVVEEFSRQLERETDLTIEAASTERMYTDFADNDNVTFPRVHSLLCTRSVLVIEEINGTVLANFDLSTLNDAQREKIASNAADVVFRQCLVVGFFHADPHPGNIFVLEDQRLAFIDCGMTGLIEPGTATLLARIVHGAVSGDLDAVCKAAASITDADRTLIEDRAFRADVWRFVDRFHSGSLESLRMGELLNEFFSIMRKYKLHCPADIVYLIKAITTIEGVAQEVAPRFEIVGHVRPYVERLISQRYSLSAMKQRLTGAFMTYSDLLEGLPGELSELSRMVRQNKISLQINHEGLDKLTREVEHASMNVAWATILGAMIVGSAVLVLADGLDRESGLLSILATAVFVIALATGMLRLVVLWWITRK